MLETGKCEDPLLGLEMSDFEALLGQKFSGQFCG